MIARGFIREYAWKEIIGPTQFVDGHSFVEVKNAYWPDELQEFIWSPNTKFLILLRLTVEFGVLLWSQMGWFKKLFDIVMVTGFIHRDTKFVQTYLADALLLYKGYIIIAWSSSILS